MKQTVISLELNAVALVVEGRRESTDAFTVNATNHPCWCVLAKRKECIAIDISQHKWTRLSKINVLC